MRSFTGPELKERCQKCWLKSEFCICATVTQIPTVAKVIVIRHIRESWKSTGTARIAQLAMPNLSIFDYGEDGEPARQLMIEVCKSSGVGLLFPSETAAVVASETVKTLVILDGTWRQARRMFHRLECLHALPVVALPTKTESVLRLREPHFTEGRSTLEAMADALGQIESEEVGNALHALHGNYVERVFRARGVFEEKSARHTTS
jgi:DTW domain-containing protein